MKLKILAVFILFSLFALPAGARPMITDMSERKIDIDAKFTGKELLLYGARVEAGNIVIVVRGPESRFVVRKKERVAGVWINTQNVKFGKVPQFYRIASSRKLTELEAEQLFKAMGIGSDTIEFGGKLSSSEVNLKDFQEALIKEMQGNDLFDFEVLNLPLLEGTLFRLRIDFPAKIPEGVYTAEIYSFNEGQLQGMQSIPISAKKVGVEAFIYNAAHEYPAVYGLLAVVLAVAMGWVAGRLFRKV